MQDVFIVPTLQSPVEVGIGPVDVIRHGHLDVRAPRVLWNLCGRKLLHCEWVLDRHIILRYITLGYLTSTPGMQESGLIVNQLSGYGGRFDNPKKYRAREPGPTVDPETVGRAGECQSEQEAGEIAEGGVLCLVAMQLSHTMSS